MPLPRKSRGKHQGSIRAGPDLGREARPRMSLAHASAAVELRRIACLRQQMSLVHSCNSPKADDRPTTRCAMALNRSAIGRFAGGFICWRGHQHRDRR